MREIFVRTWCDRHGADGVKVEGETLVLCLDGRTTREVDLCAECRDELLVPLAQAVETHGRRALDRDGAPIVVGGVKPPGRPRKAAPAPTPAAPVEAPAPADDRLDLGLVVGLDDARPTGQDEPVDCPVCGVRLKAWPSFSVHVKRQHDVSPGPLFGDRCPLDGVATRALGNHASTEHGGRTALQVHEVAERNGDPYGVAAEFRARAASYRAAA